MAFYKIAKTPIVGVYQSSGKFSKLAAQNDDLTRGEQEGIESALNIFSKDKLKAIAKVYDLSDDINDYIFPVPRAVTADTPNNNGDNFRHEELIRFSPAHRCLVYQTFRNAPLHVEHAAEDPKTARGFLPDAYYVTGNRDDKHVLTLVAMDTSKDPPMANGLLSGEIDSFSMGCICEAVTCSYCHKRATSDRNLCQHLQFYKMSHIDGQLVYEDCEGVEYQELSAVGNPADPRATTQALLRYASKRASNNDIKTAFSILSTLVSPEDQKEIARFYANNAGRLPEAMLRLADQLF